MANRTISILSSGMGLGFYIQAMLIDYQLSNAGISTEVLVFENYIDNNKKEMMNQSKKTYHENFAAALIAQRLPIDIRNSIDFDFVEELLKEWINDGRRDFIILSGHWVPIINIYKEKVAPDTLNVDLLYVDSDLSPSWKSLKKHNPQYNIPYNEIWLFNSEIGDVVYKLSVSGKKPIPFDERPNRVLAHGGGWGIGTYRSKLPDLEAEGMLLDVVIYEMDEAEFTNAERRYFANDPSWSTLIKGKNDRHVFPPFSEIKELDTPHFSNREDYHRLFDIVSEARAIIAKPGAGTLIDSFAAATPIVLLEPFGKHEQNNADIWKKKGFGIYFNEWMESGYSMEIIEELHMNLMSSRNIGTDYVKYYMDKNNI